MASQYDINLSNGNVLATLYPLEFNGPDNRSTPRLIMRARPTFPIIVATPGTDTLSLVGDETLTFRAGFQFQVAGSSGNNGTYTVQSSGFSGGNTQIVTVESITSSVADGVFMAHVFVLAGDIAVRLGSGFQFQVSGSGQVDATYTITALGSVTDTQETIIPVTHGTIRDNINTPIALPYGQLDYVNLDANTVLKLPGRGVMNYGEMIVENLVRMTENFANDVAPELNAVIGTTPVGDPLKGQLWYKTLAGEEGYKFYDGTNWSNYFDMDSGAFLFRDPQNALDPTADIYLTADESGLPAGYVGTDEAGMVIWTDANPNAMDPIFRVISTDGSERIRIEHDGWIRTANNLEVIGGGSSSNESYFHGTLGVGANGLPTIVNTLTVEGNGITVNADTGLTAEIELNAPTGQESMVNFDIAGVRHGNISVDDTATGNPLEINSNVANHIHMVNGGGNVGIDTAANPTATLQIRENIYFNEGNGNVSTASDIRFSDSGLIVSDTNTYINYDATAGGISAFEVRSGGDNVPTSVTQLHIDNDKMYVDTDTLYINTAADRVGVNMVPSYAFDVTGLSRFNSPVGINNVPPSGSPVWLEITGDVQVNSQIRGSNQSAASPTFAFTNALDTGMYNNGGVLSLAVDGIDVYTSSTTLTTFTPNVRFDSRVGINSAPPVGDVWLHAVGDIQTTTKMLTSYGAQATPSYAFTSDETTGMFATAVSVDLTYGGVVGLTLDATRILTDRVNQGVTYTFTGDTSTAISTAAAGQLTIDAVTSVTFGTAGSNRFEMEVDGTLSSSTAGYEALVIAANDIPNKAYVDDRAIPTYEEFVSVGGETIINTALKTTAKTATRATLQVFLNGLLQMEGAARNYTVTGATQLTFTVPLVLADIVVVYTFEQ